MIGWAVVSAMTALTQNYVGMVLTRFFLGTVEAPFYPGALYLLSIFYTRKELATRISVLYSGNIFASAFSGLIAAGVFNGMDGALGLKGWRWLFIIQGAVTLVCAVVACFTLPDAPLQTRWLTPEQRQLAHDRVLKDTVGQKSDASTWSGFKEAMVDPKVWVFIFMQHVHLGTNSFKNFVSLFFLVPVVHMLTPLVPHHCRQPRIQHNRHPRPNLPTLPHCRRPLYRLGSKLRAFQ